MLEDYTEIQWKRWRWFEYTNRCLAGDRNHIGIFYYRLIFNKTEKKYSHSARHVQRRMKKTEEEQELN